MNQNDHSAFFNAYSFEKIHTSDFDDKINQTVLTNQLICIFFWGQDCPNCEIAKKTLVDRKSSINTLSIKWYQADIYQDFELATRFGLFGIPAFIFFKNGKKLGKISPFPGFEPFYEAIIKLV